MIYDSLKNWLYMIAAAASLLAFLTACESTTQTAIRANTDVPAIAYVVAAQTGRGLPVPTAIIMREP